MDKLKPAKPGLRPLKAPPKPALKAPKLQDVKAHAQAALGKLRGGGPAGANPDLQEYLGLLASGSDEGVKLKTQLIARAREELDRRRHLVAPLNRVVTALRGADTQMRFRRDVLRRAQTRQLPSQSVWDAVQELLGSNKETQIARTSSILAWAESVFGTMSFSVGAGVEVGLVGGVEHAVAVSGLRHHCVAVSKSDTVAVGAYEELAGSIQAGVSGGRPETGMGLAMDVALGLACGISGEVTVSLEPTLHRPVLPDKKKDWSLGAVFGGDVYRGLVVDYSFAGLSVSVGVGEPGGGVSVGYTLSDTFVLAGVAR